MAFGTFQLSSMPISKCIQTNLHWLYIHQLHESNCLLLICTCFYCKLRANLKATTSKPVTYGVSHSMAIYAVSISELGNKVFFTTEFF